MGKYEEAMERAKELHESGNALTKLQMEIVFPVLKESEDERIRKHIIKILDSLAPCHWDGNEKAKCIAYLEKQKEQKPTNLGKPKEWSEEDEKMLSACIEAVGSMSVRSDVKTLRDWLRSLRPQPHWKPCKEQMEGLHFTPLNRLIQKIPSKNWNDTVNNYAKKLRDCLIKEGYLKDAKVLQDYISYMNGNNVPMATMDEQEQPEVDLEKEIQIWCHNPLYELTKEQDTGKAPVKVLISDIEDTARHFYELGLNARKEK